MMVGVDVRCLQDAVRTGVGEYTWQVLRALSQLREGPELVLWASGAKLIHLPELAGARVVRSHLPNRLRNLAFSLSLGPSLPQLAARGGGSPEVVWLPNPSFANLGRHVRAVVTVHDVSFVHYPEFFPWRGRLWYFPAVGRLLRRLPASALVAAVSQHTADDLVELFPNLSGCVHVVPPGVAPEYFTVPPELLAQARAELKLPAQYLLTLGTIEPRKNHEVLFLAYDELVRREPEYPYDLVVAGGWGWRTASLRRLYAGLPSRGRIHLLGYVAPELKPALYRGAHIFTYPSHYEGFGMPVLEAMAAGTPVVASHSSSLPEVVGAAGVLVNPKQPEAWLAALLWLGRDRDAHASLAARGQARARSFTWQGSAERYLELFRGQVRAS